MRRVRAWFKARRIARDLDEEWEIANEDLVAEVPLENYFEIPDDEEE